MRHVAHCGFLAVCVLGFLLFLLRVPVLQAAGKAAGVLSDIAGDASCNGRINVRKIDSPKNIIHFPERPYDGPFVGYLGHNLRCARLRQ
jgi:hypothetical protein